MPFYYEDLQRFVGLYRHIVQSKQSNCAYILTHGVSGVEWAHYKYPLPEYVYDVYIRYWKDVEKSLAKATDEYNYVTTLAKAIDEYNYVTITLPIQNMEKSAR